MEEKKDVIETLPKPSEPEAEAAIEAILFAMGNSVDIAIISEAVGIGREKTCETIRRMEEKYKAEDRGIRLIVLEDAVQLCTKKEYSDYLIRIALHPKKPVLTDVMMETLSIIAYKQPVTKVEIEKIRGVKSDFAVNKLVEYDLVQELGRLDAPGRPILFGTTEEFLRCFGIEDPGELPEADPVRIADFQAEAEEEARRKLEIVT